MPGHSWRFAAIGTEWEIATPELLSTKLEQHITEGVESFDATYSRFHDDSLFAKLAKEPGAYAFPENAQLIFDLYDELWELSEGKVSPMVGDTLASAGYGKGYSLKPGVIKPALDYKKILSRRGSKITLSQKARLDIGAIGKGYLIDWIAGELEAANIRDYVVDGSGDMRVGGEQIEKVGLEDPRDTTKVIGVIEVSKRSLCGSAGNRRAWGEWHHIIDPTTAKPVEDIIATWVVADSAMLADGLATALFFTSPQKLATRYTYEYMRMHADGSIEYSDYFSKGVFS